MNINQFKYTILILTPFLLFNRPSFAEDSSPHESAKKGVRHYNSEEYDKAFTEFMAGLEAAPDRKELQYDLGTALYKLENYPEAAGAFAKSLEQDNPELAADAWYNMGNTYLKSQNMEEAVKAYINALKLNHGDKDAKHNLELARRLMQMQQQQQQQNSENKSGQDSTKQQQQQQQQEQHQQEDKQDQQEKQDQPQQAMADSLNQPQPQPQDSTDMSKEEALELLQALEGDEQEAQKDKLLRQFGKPKRVEKDW